jgi:hypothetical protein
METQILLWAVTIIVVAYLVMMVIYKMGRCPKCNCQMHQVIDSNFMMCENVNCRYTIVKFR